ncbi:MAG: ABC transporter ATP-binding protein [Chitinophagales bacterium]|jgi:Cu-processing system ATP-binding protein|nr:ABC transporter ATP-binding protein [Bacteroidota bacterium]MBK9555793.1 ABC transporter ATP-binding protein [Bacteroidota bacterium]MBL0279436.1 ABC transporter ATP-binding protein [Bacteroidota bacterium]MBP9878820.1 ABC transporter ATP-binding protein [Chitinophagales bacterium]
MIKIRKLKKSFGKLEVLKSIDLDLSQSECIGLIGPNGCGKTTLFKSILNMVIPTQGEILVNNKSIYGNDIYRENIGFMPQIGRYPENMSIGQVLSTLKSLRPQTKNFDMDLFNQYEIPRLLNKKMGTLSGGTRQKISAVLAFMFNPAILMLDEPTAGLDPLSAEILKDKIQLEKNKGKLVLITSHLLSELDDMVSEVIFMQEGNVTFHKKYTTLMLETKEHTLAKAITHVLKTT